MINGGFECVLISTDNIDLDLNTKKYSDHIVYSYVYKTICVDDRYSKPYKIYFGEDAIDNFLYDMIKGSEYCSKVIGTEFNEPFVMNEKVHEDFNNSTKFWIC